MVLKDLATIDVKDKAHFYQMYDVGFANKTMAETAMVRPAAHPRTFVIDFLHHLICTHTLWVHFFSLETTVSGPFTCTCAFEMPFFSSQPSVDV